MPLFLPNAFSGKPSIIDDTNQFTLGIENELTDNAKVNLPGTSLVNTTSFVDYGDRVDNIWTNGLSDRTFLQIGYVGLLTPSSGAANFEAAVFIGGNQLKRVVASSSPTVWADAVSFNFATAPGKQWMTSTSDGIAFTAPPATSVVSGVTTGMTISMSSASKGGFLNVIVPTALLVPYSVGIRFRVNTGATSVTISERKLWVRAMAMTN